MKQRTIGLQTSKMNHNEIIDNDMHPTLESMDEYMIGVDPAYTGEEYGTETEMPELRRGTRSDNHGGAGLTD